MPKMIFEWDENKNNANIQKHKVSFEEAKTVFYDENALVSHDPEHSDLEDRFIIFGFSSVARILLVCFCERNQGNVIRIITARKLTKTEAHQFSRKLGK